MHPPLALPSRRDRTGRSSARLLPTMALLPGLMAWLFLLSGGPARGADPAPDLVVTNLTVNPGQPVYWNENLVIQWTLVNLGNSAVTNDYFHDRVTALGTNGHSEALVSKTQIYAAGPIAPGESRARQFTLRLDQRTLTRDYAVHVQTDISKRVVESNATGTGEQNNDSSVQVVTIGPRLHPDLVVAAVSVPSEVYTATPFELTWVVENPGTAVAEGTWADRFRLRRSTVPVFTTLAEFPRHGPLAPGERATNTATVTLDAHFTLGTYTIEMETDFGNAVAEFDGEGNNTLRFSPVQVLRGVIPHPDLVVETVKPPFEACVEQAVPVAWTVFNQGTQPVTNAWDDAVWLYPDAALTNGRRLGSFRCNTPLAPGERLERTLAVTIPKSGTTEGDYWFAIETDAADYVEEEEHETNNTAAATLSTQVRLPAKPNLRVSAVATPSTAFAGFETVVEWAVTNVGTAGTSSRLWRDTVWLSANTTWDAGDISLGWATNASYLNPGESYRNTLPVTLPSGIQGRRYVIVEADGFDQVDEGDLETDNRKSSAAVQITIPPAPDLAVTSLHAPALTFAGQRVAVTYVVTNQGNAPLPPGAYWTDVIHLSTNTVLDSPDLHGGWVRRGHRLDAGATYTNTLNAQIPSDYAGMYYLLLTTDFSSASPAGRIDEQAGEGNNTAQAQIEIRPLPPPDLELREIAGPADAYGGQPCTLTYRLLNHGPGDTPDSSWQNRLFVKVNADLQVYEPTRTNNFSPFHPLTVVGAGPDLEIVSLEVPPVVIAGESWSLGWRVENTGAGPVRDDHWVDAAWLSPTNVLDAAARMVVLRTRANPLPAGGSYTNSQPCDLVDLPAGLYYVLMQTDTADEVDEPGGEQNNVRASSQPIEYRLLPPPDLAVTEVDAPTEAFSGQPLTLRHTVTNLGQTRALASWGDAVYLSLDQVLDRSADTLLGHFRQT